MSDFTLVDSQGWEYDLHSVYSAYIGYFQVHNIPWFERTWGHLFTSFEEFLAFSWPTITVTDAHTGRAHIVTRLTSIRAFLKMVKTRFGETLPQPPNVLQVTPFETTPRHLRNISDYATYRKLYSTLPAAVLAAQRTRVRAGDAKTIKELWAKRDKTFLALSFVWSERNEKSCLEFGYAAVRCGHLEASGHWPPIPDTNYRGGHYIVEEYLDKVINRHPPNQPWQYAFGESQLTPKAKLPQIIQAVISSLASPDSETCSNTVVLVGFGTHAQLARLEEMKIKIPHVLMIDIATFERSLYVTGERGIMPDPKFERPRTPNSTLSFDNLLLSFQYQRSSPKNSSPNGSPSPPLLQMPPQPPIPQCALVNAGNEAFMSLFAFQMLLEGAGTRIPTIKKGKLGHQLSVANMNAMTAMNNMNVNMNMGMGMGFGMVAPGMGMGMGMGVSVVPGGPMPMYGIPTMPGIPPMMPNGSGVPMAGHVNGGVGGSLPPSPPLAPTPGDTKGVSPNQLRPNGVGGGKKAHRPSSAYDLSREFRQMQLSVARSYSSGAVVQSRVSGSDGEQSGKSGSRDSTSRDPSPLGTKRGHSRHNSYGSSLR